MKRIFLTIVLTVIFSAHAIENEDYVSVSYNPKRHRISACLRRGNYQAHMIKYLNDGKREIDMCECIGIGIRPLTKGRVYVAMVAELNKQIDQCEQKLKSKGTK